MNPDQKATLDLSIALLALVASTLRALGANAEPREKEGATVLATEIDAIVEGIGNLCKPSASS